MQIFQCSSSVNPGIPGWCLRRRPWWWLCRPEAKRHEN